jgi:hypothetical protein
LSQGFNVRKGAHEEFIFLDNSTHLGLLEHDLRYEDRVRIGRLPPW